MKKIALSIAVLILIVNLQAIHAETLTWTQVNTSGFGDAHNIGVYTTAIFKGYLYACTNNFYFSGNVPISNGGEIWRSPDGTTWTQVNTNGFVDENNKLNPGFIVFNDYLYASTTNEKTGGQIWRSSDGTTWEQVIINPAIKSRN